MHGLTSKVMGAGSVRLLTPDLDGDSVGALAALAMGIRQRWPAVAVSVVVPEPMPARYGFLMGDVPFAEADGAPGRADLCVVVDGAPGRLGPLLPWFETAACRAILDHHRSSKASDADVSLIDRGAASTTLLVLELLDHWGVRLDRGMASAIWAGLIFDTSLFRYKLSSPRALRAAARLLEVGIDHAGVAERVLLQQSEGKARLRALVIDRMAVSCSGALAMTCLSAADVGGAESGGLTDELVFIEGVEVGALVMDRGDDRVKVSLRSRGRVDVSAVGAGLSEAGGGHARAAGATVRGASMAEVAARVESLVGAALS
jgi:bifunctional oligoribonuclease and PAP phosphatase NrnA